MIMAFTSFHLYDYEMCGEKCIHLVSDITYRDDCVVLNALNRNIHILYVTNTFLSEMSW